MLLLIGWDVKRLDFQRHMKFLAQVADELLISLGLYPPEVEVAVGSVALAAQVEQDAQQRYRVSPTAQSHQHRRVTNGVELIIIVSLDSI